MISDEKLRKDPFSIKVYLLKRIPNKDLQNPQLNVQYISRTDRCVSHQEGFPFIGRVVYDLLFFFILIIIVLNLIFGVIIDTFADLRSEKQQKDDVLKNTCFICGELVDF